MTNKEEIYGLLQAHPEGLDDDDITEMTGIQSRQQVQWLCSQLANSKRIRRHSVEKVGKRRKIHNFPLEVSASTEPSPSEDSPSKVYRAAERKDWQRRLSALVAATNRPEADLLDEALQLLALKILQNSSNSGTPVET